MLALTNADKTFDRGDNLAQSSDIVGRRHAVRHFEPVEYRRRFSWQIWCTRRRRSLKRLLVHGSAFRDWPGAMIDSAIRKSLMASPMGWYQR